MSSEPDYKIERRTRARHKLKFWREYDKEEYRCPRCTRSLDEVVQFEVHHQDGNPRNGDVDNLIGLCRACHYREHGRTPPQSLEDWKDDFLDI